MHNQHALVLPLGDLVPQLDASSWVAPGAQVVGDVTLGADSSVWYGAVLRADREAIRIGTETNLQDNVVVHADPGYPAVLGDRVSIGHAAVVHGCTIEDGSLVGMNAVVMNGAVVGRGCIIAAGTVVLQGTEVPDGSLVAGVPGKVRRTVSDEERERNRASARRYVDRIEQHRAALSAT